MTGGATTDRSSPDLPTIPAGVATGVGSMPGTDVRDTVRLLRDELPDLVPLPELPTRGAGADMLGRTLALLPDFAAETVPTGWRLTQRPGPDLRRARAWLDEDLDAAEELLADHGGAVKVALTGPLTLAACVELVSGERAARDHGAVRELAAALADAVGRHVQDVRRRLPRSGIVLQLDEPALPSVLAARVPTASGFATLRRIDGPVVEALLRQVVDAAVSAGAVPVVHSCAADVPVGLLRRAGARGVSLDLGLLPRDGSVDEELGTCVEAGVRLLLGVVATDGTGPSEVAGTVEPVRRLWHRIGFDPASAQVGLGASVVVTPTCGLAGASPAAARAALVRSRDAARLMVEDPED